MLTAVAPTLLFLGLALVAMPLLKSDGRLGRLVFCAVSAFLLIRYCLWRITETLPPFSLEGMWAYIYLCLELGAGLSSLFVLVMLSRTMSRSAEADANLSWVRETSPKVAIFIASYNEEHSILERTMIGAQSQTYKDVIVCMLDDGRRDWLRALCERRGVHYLTREDNSHAKAGNMNNGLAWLRANAPDVEYIAILDADFVAQPLFVERSLALMRSGDVGLVQTPQHFFNPDPMQHSFRSARFWPDEQRFFFDVLLPSKDAWNNAFSCGTSSIVRRSAVEEIGGFPTESVTEDMLLSIKLRTAGHRTVYLNERLSMGLAPEGVGEYITQRGRWCLGAMQIVRSEYGLFSKKPVTFWDRVGLLDTLLYWGGSFLFRFATVIVPIVYWTFGISAFVTDFTSLLFYGAPHIIAQIVVMAWISRGRILPVMTDANQLLTAPVAIRAVAVGLSRPTGHKFKVTAKGGDHSRIVIQWSLMRPALLLLALTALATIYGTTFSTGTAQAAHGGTLLTLFWSYYAMLILTVTVLTCVELPRHRDERFECGELITIKYEDGVTEARSQNLAEGGIRLQGNLGLPMGTRIDLEIPDVGWIPATVHDVGKRHTVAVFEPGDGVRDAIVRKLFSGKYNAPPEQVSSLRVFGAIARRIAS